MQWFFKDFKPVHAAGYVADLDAMMMLGEAGADLAAPSARGFTALSAPFLNKHLTLEKIKPVVDYLLANGDFGEVCKFGLKVFFSNYYCTVTLEPQAKSSLVSLKSPKYRAIVCMSSNCTLYLL